jgi:hypothetical protein
MKMKTTSIVSFGLVCLFAAATFAADAPAPAAGASPEAIAAGKKIDWAKMDENSRKAYMKKTVLPTMKKLFVGFDKKHYSSMSCATCHGEKAAENKFKMPNPTLPKLPTERAGFMALQQKKPEAVKFMGEKVKPTMAALLGLPEWTMTNQTGFGCYQCHTKEEAAATPPPAMGKPAAPAPAAPGGPAKGW